MEFVKAEAGDYKSTDGKIRIAHTGGFWYRVPLGCGLVGARACYTLKDALNGDTIMKKPTGGAGE
jgi:hypothetical protein